MKKITLNETAYLEYAPLERVYGAEKRPVLLILPGGGYTHLADHEAYPLADIARANGMHAAILRYTILTQRLVTLDDLLGEVKASLDYLAGQTEDGLDLDQVYVVGFSAGGHLAAWVSHRLKDRVARVILGYPAVHMELGWAFGLGEEELEQATKEHGLPKDVLVRMCELFMAWPEKDITPESAPTFIFHSQDDPVCPVSGTLLYAQRLMEAKVPTSLHVFSTGGHGNSLGSEVSLISEHTVNEELMAWWPLLMTWLKTDLPRR